MEGSELVWYDFDIIDELPIQNLDMVFSNISELSFIEKKNTHVENFMFDIPKVEIPDNGLYEQMIKMENALDEQHQQMLDTAGELLKNYWTIPYSWVMWIIEYLKSTKIKVLCYDVNRVIIKEVSLGDIINTVEHPYVMFGLINIAARTNGYLWDAIWNSARVRYPNSSFRIIEFNKIVWKFVAKGVIKNFIKDRIEAFLKEKKYTFVETDRRSVEGLVKQITKQFKWFFFKRF